MPARGGGRVHVVPARHGTDYERRSLPGERTDGARPLKAPDLVLPAIGEREGGAVEQIARRPRHEHLAGPGERHDARCHMHGQPADVGRLVAAGVPC